MCTYVHDIYTINKINNIDWNRRSTQHGLNMCMMQLLQLGIYFFFQAEDGIRDYKVTGVQTCALPISSSSNSPASASQLAGTTGVHHHTWLIFVFLVEMGFHHVGQASLELLTSGYLRSEERRVGKECRSRWSPYH